jgi:hypothetical protein
MRHIHSFHKLLLPLAISAALVACGGGSKKNSSAAPTTSIGGQSSKGIVIGGIVNAYPITSTGTVNKSTSLANPATTADDGSYSLSLNSNYVPGTAIYVEITATNGTLMRCDLAKCGDKDFGDTYTLASSFAMSATLPSATGTSVAVNITPITDIASKLTLQKVASGANPSAAAAGSNAQVASRLGLTGSLIDQAIIDITNADSVNSASQAALEYNLKSAAAVAAALKGNTTLSLEDAMSNFVNQFSSGGIADKEDSNSDAVTLEELLEEALALLDKVKAVPGVEDSNAVSSSGTSLTAAEADAQNNGSSTASQGDVPDDVGSEGLLASKAFVKQLRNLASAGVVSVNQKAFAEQIDLAGASVSADSDIVAEALGLGLNAIATAYQQYQDAPDESKPSSIDVNGITVATFKSGGTLGLSIEQSVTLFETNVTIDLNADDATTIVESSSDSSSGNETTFSDTGSATAALNVSGSAASSDVSITITDGSFTGTLSYDEQSTETQETTSYSETWNAEVTVASIDARLSITLAQLTADNNVSFTGSMALKLGELLATEDGSYSVGFSSETFTEQEQYTETLGFDGFEISLAGEFSDTAGNAVSASLAASIDNFNASCREESAYTELNGYSYSYDCQLDETASNYAIGSLTMIFELDLTGVEDDVNIEFNANRSGIETGVGTLNLRYGGKQLNLIYQGANTATLSNHNGVTMTLTETETDGEVILSGDIKQDETSFATISDSSGAVLVRYSDGSFETVM